jgi:hypothetical protein
MVLCVQVRSRDRDGQASDWAATSTCISRAFGAGDLGSRGRVTTVHGKHLWLGRARVIGRSGQLTLAGVTKGSRVRVFLTLHRGIDNVLAWQLPGRRIDMMAGFGRDHRVQHTVAVNSVTGASRRRGPLVFTAAGSNAKSLPLEGVALMPPWMFA